MGNIVLLDDLTINKIAAGEVIERPASVVKEMLENSIDAGATKITVEIKNGGISFIRISDNGKGIAEDDMEIAFERHATSKIRQADDITKVTSMGFRGEALASIAAIANVEMISRTKDSNTGHKIVVEGGKVLEKSEVGAPIGTTITVKNLFYNTPVRYKFLKKDYTESGYIEDAITRLALVNNKVAFKLINSGKTVIQTAGNGDEKSVIYSIYGKDIAEAVINTEYEYEGMKVTGVVGKPEIARSNRSNQLYFINKRYIKDRTLTAAAEQAFKGMIPINKYGFLILNIEMDPALVDVNVHPAKLEVRFEEENKVFKAVYYAIKESLSKKELVESVAEEEKDGKILEKTSNKEVDEKNLKEKSEEVITAIKDDIETEKENNGKFLFFKKGKKEEQPKENDENLVEEVYKFRKGLKELGISEVPAVYSPLKDLEKLDENENKSADESESSVPSEEKVQAMTEELIKKRAEEAFNSVGKENTEPSGFDDMYTKVFGNKEPITLGKDEKELSDTQKKVLDDIMNKVRKDEKKDGQPDEEKTEGAKAEKKDAKVQESSENTDEVLKKEPSIENVNKESENQKQDESIGVLITEENSEQIDEFKNMAGKNYKFIGIVFDTYIVVEIEKEMYIIDQHAAHERIRYEKVKKNYYSETDKDSQLMLLPDIITLSHKEAETIKENLEMFEKAGFSLEAFGENTIKLTGVPNICIDMNTKQLFLELLDEIDNYGRTDRQDKEDRFIATIACKSAVKANMKLTESEVDKLMEKLLELPNPFTCPHGRPTAIKMSKYEIERKFARK